MSRLVDLLSAPFIPLAAGGGEDNRPPPTRGSTRRSVAGVLVDDVVTTGTTESALRPGVGLWRILALVVNGQFDRYGCPVDSERTNMNALGSRRDRGPAG